MARRRNKKQEDFLNYPYTPDRQLTHPSGWCMTSDHDGCRYQFNHGKCACDCHTQKTQQASEPIASIVDAPKKRGRPKGSKNKPKEIING